MILIVQSVKINLEHRTQNSNSCSWESSYFILYLLGQQMYQLQGLFSVELARKKTVKGRLGKHVS